MKGPTLRHNKHITNALAELIYELYREHAARQKKDKYWRFAFHDYPLLLNIQDNLMPRGKKVNTTDAKPNGKTSPTETVWVNVRFTPEQIQEVLHLSENVDELAKSLASLLTEGYGFSVRANADKANFSAFITGIPSHDGTKLYAISGFAPSATGATASVLVKYYAVLDDPSLLSSAQSSAGIG